MSIDSNIGYEGSNASQPAMVWPCECAWSARVTARDARLRIGRMVARAVRDRPRRCGTMVGVMPLAL